MPADTPPFIAQIYGLVVLLAGLGCFIHFFFLKGGQNVMPEPAAAPPWRLSIGEFSLGASGVVLGALVVQGLVIGVTSIGLDGAAEGIVIPGYAFHLAVLGCLLGLYKAWPEKFTTPFNGRDLSWPGAAKAAIYSFLLIVPIIYPATLAWQHLLEKLDLPIVQQDVVGHFAEAETVLLLVLMILLTTVVAPLSEEFFFRGCLYRFLKAKMPLTVALLLNGLLFAALHVSLSSLLPLIILGIVLAYAYEKTGSIKVPILMHAIFNTNTIIVILLTHHLA